MGLGGLSYPNESNFKKKKKINPNGRIGKIGRIPYDLTILCNPTYDPTIFAILLRFKTFWWGGIVKSCDFTIRIAILTTMLISKLLFFLLRIYFYIIGISFDKTDFTCIWVYQRRFKMIITSDWIEDMQITQELLKKSAIYRSRHLLDKSSICQDSLKLDTCLDLSNLWDSNYSQQCFYSKKLFVYGFV